MQEKNQSISSFKITVIQTKTYKKTEGGSSDRDAREIKRASLFACRLRKTTSLVLWV